MSEYATRQGLIARDPAEYVEAPRQRPTKVTAADVWTQHQVQTFAAKATEDRLYAVFLMSCYGLRRSEVCGLRWTDIDLSRGTLSVEQSHVEVEGKEHAVDEPKTERSRRTLPIPDDVATALRELKTRQKRERLALGRSWDETTHVCSDQTGKPVLPRTFTGWFHRSRVAPDHPTEPAPHLVIRHAPRRHPSLHRRRLARARRADDHGRLQPGLRRRSDRSHVGHVRHRRDGRRTQALSARWHSLGTLTLK